MRQSLWHGIHSRHAHSHARRRVTLAALLLAAAPALFAERYAILAGVGNPEAGGGALSGPRNDVEALRERLARFSFAPRNIRTLLDADATRQSILDAVRGAVSQAGPGDIVLFYFSGHGTSNFDGELGAELPSGTGALIPFDAAKSKPVAGSLIVGNRDLRGIFLKLHPEALGLIVLDACYSEDAAKSAAAAPRAIRFWAPPQRRPGWRRVESLVRETFAKAADPYPYRNILTLTASARYQPAFDIPPDELRSGAFRTVDGRPHGAMSNAFLAGLDGRADSNRDGQLTYRELFRFVQETVNTEFPQHPQYQHHPSARDLLDQPVFRANPTLSPARSSGAAGVPPVLVELSGDSPELQSAVGSVPGVRVGVTRADYSLRAETHGGYSLNQLPKGTEVAVFPGTALDQIKATLGVIAASRQLSAFRFAASRAALSIEAEPADQGWYYDGQTFRITGSTTEAGTAFLVSIDSTGVVNVLYPVAGEGRWTAGQKVNLLTAKVSAPYGTSTLKLFLFDKPPAGLERFYCTRAGSGTRCLEFPAGSPSFRELMSLLNSHEGDAAEFTLKVETRP